MIKEATDVTRKINFRKILTTIPYDSFVSQIHGLVGRTKNVTLDVNIASKRIYELEDTMFVFLDILDNTGNMSAVLVGNRNVDFRTLVQNIKLGLKYRIAGNISLIDDSLDDLPFRDEISGDKLFCIYAIQNLTEIN